MRHLLLLGVLACANTQAAPDGDLPPIRIKEPPEDRDTDPTAPACEGITKNGQCEGNVAVRCDVIGNELIEIDCGTTQQCVKDVDDGAVCRAGTGGEGCGAVTPRGTCEDGVAVWCDGEDVLSWSCAGYGMACEVDTCADGAYCCDGNTTSAECDTLGVTGECAAGKARWCQNGQVIEQTCDSGEVCAMNDCAVGAQCCPPANSCGTVTAAGVCTGSVLSYCDTSAGQIRTYDCAAFNSTCVIRQWGASCE